MYNTYVTRRRRRLYLWWKIGRMHSTKVVVCLLFAVGCGKPVQSDDTDLYGSTTYCTVHRTVPSANENFLPACNPMTLDTRYIKFLLSPKPKLSWQFYLSNTNNSVEYFECYIVPYIQTRCRQTTFYGCEVFLKHTLVTASYYIPLPSYGSQAAKKWLDVYFTTVVGTKKSHETTEQHHHLFV